jgi:xanthomonalisin
MYSRFLSSLLCVAMVVAAGSSALAERQQLTGKQHVPDAVTDGSAKLVAHAGAAQRYELAMALPVRNEAALDALLAEQQNPHSPLYHRWLSVEEFAARFAPGAAEYARVTEFLKAQGFQVTTEHENRLAVSFSGSTQQVERAFHVTMNNYRHPAEDRTFFAPDREPAIDGLDTPVLLIAGLDNYVLPHARLKRNPAAAAVAEDATPRTTNCTYNVDLGNGACGTYSPTNLRTAYYGGTAETGSGQQIGILGFGGAEASDVTLMAGQENQTAPTVKYILGSACAAKCSDGEQVLDIIFSSGMAPGATINFFSNASNDLTIINKMASSKVSSVYSCSWGWGKSNHAAEDTDFKEMQSQGQTFLNATGDDGGYNSTTWAYPSGDPYITEVGGTSLVTNGVGGGWSSETGWTGSSGGVATGISYTIPTWQAPAANSSNGISTTKRSDPDVAAEADFNQLSCSKAKCTDGWGGTSYAAPQWAGYFAMVNQARVAAGAGTLGFPNPSLYSIGLGSSYNSDFHDSTACQTGTNPCNDSDAGSPVVGYNAVVGFDDVTGWGSPNGSGLINSLK